MGINLGKVQDLFLGSTFRGVINKMGRAMGAKIPVDFQIGFSDSHIVSFESGLNSILIFLKSWDEKILKLEFMDSISFIIFDSWDIADIYRLDDSPLLNQALKFVYESMPLQHPYRSFQFIDNDDNVAAEVCCKDLIITIES